MKIGTVRVFTETILKKFCHSEKYDQIQIKSLFD